MLTALLIRDFALIDQLHLELPPGLTVITGETGAGKSMVVDALSLVLGDRARAEAVRGGAEEASVEALFDLRRAPEVRARLLDAGIEAGDELVVRRVVRAGGRSRVWLNGTLATLQMLARVTEGLVDISGQHEHYSLLRAEAHLDLLDEVAGHGSLRAAVAEAHQLLAGIDARIADVRARQRDRAEREAFLRFQLEDLRAARLDDPDEEAALETEARRLGNVEKLRKAAGGAAHELYDADGAAVSRLQRALQHLNALVAFDPSLKALAEDLQGAVVVAEDAGRTLSDYARDLEAEPERLEAVHARLMLFTRLRRKFGATLAEVMARQAEMEAELALLEGGESAVEGLQAQRKKAAAALLGAAQTLTAARQAAGADLARRVGLELQDLGMGGATLAVRVDPLTAGLEVDGRHIGPRGADRVEFLLGANPGEAPGPLNRIASGGELSRFMLAVKQVVAERDPVSTYIFDEVDTGVGGPTAVAIGRKLRGVAANRQALCITHLPQIAAMGDHHLFVSKGLSADGRTRSVVTTLDHAGRVDEISRMLGATHITETTRAAARELLSLAVEAPASPAQGARAAPATPAPQAGSEAPEAPEVKGRRGGPKRR